MPSDLPPLRYVRPTGLADALTALALPGACIYAGGTDLVVALGERRPWTRFVRTVVDVKALAEARGLGRHGRGLRIGALTTAHELAHDPRVRRLVPVLAEAAAMTASPALRRRGTVGGNLVTPHPAGDVTTALLALGAEVEVAVGRRVVVEPPPVFLAAQAKAWPRQRLVLGVRVPAAPRSAFERLAPRSAFSRALVAVAVAVVGRRPRVALGGLGARPLLAPATADALRTPPASRATRATERAALAIERAALAIDCPPPGDADGAYRLHVAHVLLARARARVRA